MQPEVPDLVPLGAVMPARVEEGARLRMWAEEIRSQTPGDVVTKDLHVSSSVRIMEHVRRLPRIILGLQGKERGVGEDARVLGELAQVGMIIAQPDLGRHAVRVEAGRRVHGAKEPFQA